VKISDISTGKALEIVVRFFMASLSEPWLSDHRVTRRAATNRCRWGLRLVRRARNFAARSPSLAKPWLRPVTFVNCHD